MKDDSSSYCASNIESLPEGRLGVLKIYKSRRVTFNLGDHEFEVNQGSDCNFSQVRKKLFTCERSIELKSTEAAGS